jgi:hypothetical protein
MWVVHFPFNSCLLSRSRRKRLLGLKNIDGMRFFASVSRDSFVCMQYQHHDLDQAHPPFAVYALGFYVDEEAAQKALGPKFSNAESNLAKNQSLCDGSSSLHCGLVQHHLHAFPCV